MMGKTWRFNLKATAEASRRARTAVRSAVGNSPRLEDLLLATSELISNAIRHGETSGDDAITMEVFEDDDRIRVSVSHRGAGFRRGEGIAATSGFGLNIVAAVSSRWDTETHSGITETWFEIEARSE